MGKILPKRADEEAPAKKDNKKGSHIPPELHDQWARDREKKAEKKRARELERLAVLLDPYPASRKAKGKKQEKGRQAAAAAFAHMIPRSAEEVAELFDVSSGEDAELSAIMKGKKVRSLLLPPTLEIIDRMVRDFLMDKGKTTITLPPMDKEARKKVHMLAECYDLKSKSKGKGHQRFPWVTRALSCIPMHH